MTSSTDSDDVYLAYVNKQRAFIEKDVQMLGISLNYNPNMSTVIKTHELKRLQGRMYSTESDEPFREVHMDWPVEKPLNHVTLSEELQVLVAETTIDDWDPLEEYGDVWDAVEAAARDTPRIFLREEKTRTLYWIVGLRKSKHRLVGVWTLAIDT